MPQYFENNPDLISQQSEISAFINNESYTFITDNGVFSKRAVDYGTKVMLESHDLKNPKRLLDMGCGYGVVGIVLKRSFPDAVIKMFDINARAIGLAKENIMNNHQDINDVIVSDGVPDEWDDFDAAFLNPPIRAGKDVVFKLYDQAYKALNNKGSLYVVIQKKQGAKSTEKYLKTFFKDVILLAKDKGYSVFKANKS